MNKKMVSAVTLKRPTAEPMACSEVRFVKELYPRLKPLDDVVERYRDAIDQLPHIIVARDGVLVDGYHRWQAHVRENRDTILAENIGNLTDAEIVRESITRNATHGQQLSRNDKARLAGHLWMVLADLDNAERIGEIVQLLAVSRRTVEEWTRDVRRVEKETQQAKAFDLWLDCVRIGRKTVGPTDARCLSTIRRQRAYACDKP